ncbi:MULTISPECIES: DUF4395 domain-containing protein [Kitasatospora]|uniref:DUF4395 domain-containing protein n=1 Tax=Kitasatospora cathayae TaxID=3004092 RepID=A0ABY7PZA9_9ACTN|nr:DUF4395 domain-containing protein [Kitasatospora sp. HUAS 3-15]WBP85737.1 DUF4395 domain-containing protein [Kitasatospora sp. HUAS 3-15]
MQTDPRGHRFAAALSALVLAAVLITGSGLLLAAQALVFTLGAFGGPRLSPYGWLFHTFIAPRLAPPTETEDERPLRFAQGGGAVFAAVGVLGYLTEVTWLGLLATAFGLAVAFLNAAFGYCLGCEIYPIIRRAQGRLSAGA